MKHIQKIIDVKPYIITCLWNDGVTRKINLEDFLKEKSVNKMDSYFQLMDISKFLSVQTDGVTLYWPNSIEYTDYDGSKKMGNLDISPEFLLELAFEKDLTTF